MKLKKARKRAGYSQEETAELCNISLRHYQNIEYGTSEPTVGTGLIIAKLFGVSPYYIDEWYTRLPVSMESKKSKAINNKQKEPKEQ